MLKKSLGLVSGAALMFVFAYGCSSSETTPAAGTDGGNTPTEAGKKETGTTPDPDTDGGGGGDCKPGDVASFEPTWKAPVPPSAKCTQAQIDALLDCLLDENADQTACKTITADKNNKDCGACLLTPSSAAKYGPVISADGLVSVNLAGCIAIKEGDLSANGCGAKFQALNQCGDEACAANCPVTDDASFAAYQKCTQAAEAGACSKFAGDAACIDDLVKEGGAAEDCDLQSAGSFIDNAKKYAGIFCGGATSDGGTDAPADAPTEGG